jgi:hypothetical protein
MSTQRLFPFRRVAVDHMVRGVTRVWWQLEPAFNDPGPRIFQLQYGNTALRDSPDWHNVGGPITDGYLAYDAEWRNSASDLLTHYRVTLTTDKDIYVSQAVSCFGELAERDWVLAREIIRKEQLRHKYVSVSGYLLKPYRFGRPCVRCRDQLTGEVLDSNCPICNGTGFEVGYHPALPMQCWDLTTQTISEHQDDQLKGTTRENAYVQARVIGFPTINRNDIWVNGSSDERWLVHDIQIAAAMRGVPLIYNIRLGLMPFASPVYAIEVGGEPAERPGPELPKIGCGSVPVDHNYGGPDNMVYRDATGYSVVGATVWVFPKDIYDAAAPDLPNRSLAVANTTTRVNGRWTDALMLDPGDYALIFEKPGEYGPDVDFVAVVEADAESSCAWFNTMELGGAEESDALYGESSEAVTTDNEEKVCGPRADDDFWNF